MLSLNEAIVGAKVRCLCDFPSVPMDTIGQIVEDYGTGIMVAWDLPDRPLPAMTPAEISEMYAINPKCPLRDGFDKETEFDFLETAEPEFEGGTDSDFHPETDK